MSNYEYIIASLPYLTQDYHYASGMDFAGIVAEIRENLSDRDAEGMDFLLKGFEPDSLDAEFYTKAFSQRNRFLREYFRFDLNMRNAKVRYLNRELGRDAGTDVIDIDGGEFYEESKAEAILEEKDILEREKGLDFLCWDKIDSLAIFHYFDLTAVLGYLAKLHIVDRWLTLDEEKGREMFRRLVSEVRGSFKGVHFTEK